MGYGELPARASMRVYWKLEDVNDSSGNSKTLTNATGVGFISGRFSKAANFGSSGTGQTLQITGGTIFSTQIVNAFTISFWFKLNNVSASNVNAGLYAHDIATGGNMSSSLIYNISGGNITLTWRINLVTTSVIATVILPADGNWHHVVCIRNSQTTNTLIIDGYTYVANGVGSGANATSNGLSRFSIGNGVLGSTQAWAMIDEFIVEQRIWSASEIRKYYTQSQGRLVAA